jgi:poly-gamma-glutamate synthesis protein (capsule biosynthesis protein)
LLSVGDIMLGRSVATESDSSGLGEDYPFALVNSLTHSADLTFGNLESPLVSPANLDKAQSKGYLFPGRPQSAQALKKAGFGLVTFANNHALDYGSAGVEDTLTALEAAGVGYVGAGTNPYAPRYLEKNGLKLAFIAATDVPPSGLKPEETNAPIALFEQDKILKTIVEAHKKADVVIVALHWGEEYQAVPSLRQQEFAKQAAASGANLILGAHPHVVGQFEVIGQTVVAYSLGNFVFDSRYPPETHDSVGFYVKLDKKGVVSAQAIPLKIEKERPRPLLPAEQQEGLSKLAALAEDSPSFKAAAIFWNGNEWQTAPALSYMRDSNSNGTIALPTTSVLQTRDIINDKGGYNTGKAVENLADEPQVEERIELKEGRLRVWRPDTNGKNWRVIWQSKPGWQVEQFTFGDADEDGRYELMFSMWKNDGWDDAGEYRSHPFVYGWRRGAFRPVWAGSVLSDPIREFALADFDGDGRNELMVLEGKYEDERHAPAHYVTMWRWNGWGYELLYRSSEGKYSAAAYVPGTPYAFFKRFN